MINPLNDISRVYLEQISESAVPGQPAERLGAVTAIPTDEREKARQRTLAKAAALRAKKGITQEALDPVGNEDADIDNDGKPNTKKDKYLMNRRNVIGQEIAKEAKEVKKWWDDDGDGIGYEEGEVSGKFKKKKKVKEGFSNWRDDLREVIDVIDHQDNNQRIVEKSVSNKIKINPSISEAVKNLGGELIEMVEIDEVAPPGGEGTVRGLKKHKNINNPYALAWWMKNRGYKLHKSMEEAIAPAPTAQSQQKPQQSQKNPQNTSAINQVLAAKAKTAAASRNLTMAQRMAAQKGVNLGSISAEETQVPPAAKDAATNAKIRDASGAAFQKNPTAFQDAIKQMAADRKAHRERQQRVRNNPNEYHGPITS
jgi:hypothetical protein